MTAEYYTPDPDEALVASDEVIQKQSEEIERLRTALDKMQRSRDRYRRAWEAEKTRAALAQGGE